MIQWQHGDYYQSSNGTLHLRPYASDGRQQLSEPCDGAYSTFRRYNQSETFLGYEQLLDRYNDRERLNLLAWDGTPAIPMWLIQRPPQMLPTTTLHPSRSDAADTDDLRMLMPPSKILSRREVKDDTTLDGQPMTRPILTLTLLFWLGFFVAGAGSLLMWLF